MVQVGVVAVVRDIVETLGSEADGLVDGFDDEVDADFDVVIEEQQGLDRVGVGRLVLRQGFHVVEDRVGDLLGAHVGDDSVRLGVVKGKKQKNRSGCKSL